MHAQGGQASVVAVDHVEQQTAVGKLVEGECPFGQHCWRQLAGVLGDQEAQAMGGVDQRCRHSQAFVGAGAEQRAIVAQAVSGDGQLLEVLEIGVPAAFGLPGIGAVGGGEVPEDLYCHGVSPCFR